MGPRRLLQIVAVVALGLVSTPLWLVPLADRVMHEEGPMIDIRAVVLSTWKANEYLVAPAGFTPQAPPHRVAPVYDRPAEEIARRLKGVILAERRIEWRDDSGLKLEVIQRSKVFRFPDTVTIEVLPLDSDRATLAIYSRSRYGRRDFGVNRDRVEAWLARLETMLK